MDLADLKARAQRAREFTHTCGDCTFTLRTPTRLEMRQCMHERGLDPAGASPLLPALLQRYLLERFVVGWMGPRESHVVADAGPAPLPWSADAVPLLLDAQPAWADELGTVLLASVSQRAERIEADAGN